jgi:hypothetical protein
MSAYTELAEWLKRKGIGSYLQGPDQLVVSSENPAMPAGNCFWVRRKGGSWYIGTWLPAGYHVTDEQDIHTVCEAVFRSSATAMYKIEPALAGRLGVRRLSDDEMELLGFT